jgi:hypothetical protein
MADKKTDQETTQDNPQGSNTATPQVKPEEQKGKPEPTFTQKQLDNFLEERLRRDRETQQAKLKERYGVDDLADVEKLLEEQRKRKEADMSELEKVQAASVSKDERIASIEKELATIKANHLQGQRDTFIKEHLLTKGARPEDISNLLILVNQTMTDDKAALFSADKPTPESSKLDAFTKQVQGNFSMYFGSAGAGSPAIGTNSRNPSPAIAKEEAEKAIKRKFSSM